MDFWQWGSGYVPGFNTLVGNFNKSQKVQVAAANPSDYWNKVVTTQASGTGPDVFLMNNVNFKQWAHNGLVADLSSYLNPDKDASASLKAMTPSLVTWYQYQGKTMGVPWDFSAGVVGFNLDQLRAVGLTSPNDQGKQWDWNMMRDYATKLTQKSSSAITRSGIWINAGLENGYYSFCVANGGSFFNADLNQCTIATAESIAGLDFVLTMSKTASPQPPPLKRLRTRRCRPVAPPSLMAPRPWTLKETGTSPPGRCQRASTGMLRSSPTPRPPARPPIRRTCVAL